MGNLISTADASHQVREAVGRYNVEIGRLQRSIHVDGCPGLSVTDMRSLKKYRQTPLRGSWALTDSGPITGELHADLCKAVRQREAQKVFLAKQIVTALEKYSNVLDWLLQGDYCAVRAVSAPGDFRNMRWDIKRFSPDAVGTFSDSTCEGIYRPPFRLLDSKTAPDTGLTPVQMYRLADAENADWKELVDTLKSDFNIAWKRLKKLLSKLLVDEILPIETLSDIKQSTIGILSDIEESFQNFMSMTLGEAGVRPYSIDAVGKMRLQNAVQQGELAAQKEVIREAGKDSKTNMQTLARAHWRSPLNSINVYTGAGRRGQVGRSNPVQSRLRRSRKRRQKRKSTKRRR